LAKLRPLVGKGFSLLDLVPARADTDTEFLRAVAKEAGSCLSEGGDSLCTAHFDLVSPAGICFWLALLAIVPNIFAAGLHHGAKTARFSSTTRHKKRVAGPRKEGHS
jgi:hypothetical protein